MKTLLKDFIKCGTIGWCLEILFTSMNSLRRRNGKLQGITSIWMFPIYGCACLLRPISKATHSLHFTVRGVLYMCLIFMMEYLSGTWLSKKELCPWDYSHDKWNIDGVIRLDYAPFWFLTGLLFERLLGTDEVSQDAS